MSNLNLESDQLKKEEWRRQLAFNPSPVPGDFGPGFADKDSSSYLQRWNKVQREQLEHELKRIDREEKRMLRDAHLDLCAVAKLRNDLKREKAMNIQRRVNASTQGKLLTPISSARSQRLGPPSAGASKSPPGSATSSAVARRTSVSDMASLLGQSLSVGPKTNLSKSATTSSDKAVDDTRGIKTPSSNTDSGKKNETERRPDHIDHRRREELTRMRRVADKTTRSWNTEFTEHSKSMSRTGAPLLPTSVFSSSSKNNTKKSASRESVFNRLSKDTKITSMSQDDFLKNMKTRAAKQRPVRQSLPSGGNNGNLLTIVGNNSAMHRGRSLSPRFRTSSDPF